MVLQQHHSLVVDTLFVDDAALLLADRDAVVLVTRVQLAMQIIHQVFAEFQLVINFEKGKTEVSFFFAGANSKIAKQKVFC